MESEQNLPSKETNEVPTEVLVNTVHPDSVTETVWVDNSEPLPITEFEKNINKDFITPEQLLEREKQEEEIKKQKIESEEEKIKNYRRDYITKLKVVALDNLGRDPLSNPSRFTTRDKKRLIETMDFLHNTKSEEEITLLFNNVCNEVIFAPEAKYEFYSVHTNF